MGLMNYGNDGFMSSGKSKKKRKSTSNTTPKKKKKSKKSSTKKSESYFGIDAQGFEDSIQGAQTMYHDIKNFKQNVRNTKTRKMHDKIQAHKKQEKLNTQRIRDEAYLKKIQQEKQERIVKIQAEKLRKRQHAILDKYGYVEGRKILAKQASMKPSILSKLRKRVIGY